MKFVFSRIKSCRHRKLLKRFNESTNLLELNHWIPWDFLISRKTIFSTFFCAWTLWYSFLLASEWPIVRLDNWWNLRLPSACLLIELPDQQPNQSQLLVAMIQIWLNKTCILSYKSRIFIIALFSVENKIALHWELKQILE